MSYCRKIDGDLYVYPSIEGVLVCCGCSLMLGPEGADWNSFTTTKRSEMIAHVREHAAAGHEVQPYVIPKLEAEIAATGDDITKDSEALS